MSDLASAAIPDPTAASRNQVRRAPDTNRSAPAAARGPSSLPLPSLEDTCTRYLEMARPLVPLAAWERTAHAASRLAATGGPLQDALRQIAGRRGGNYVGGFWRDMYLEARAPLAPYQNAGALFRLPAALARHSLPRRAAAIAVATAQISRLVAAGSFVDDPAHGRGLCQAQHRFVFGTVRLPGLRKDRLVRTHRPTHFVVSHRGRLHHLPLPETAWPRAAARKLEPLFQAIIAGREPDEAVAALTSLSRPDWFHCRRRLRRDPVNAASLRAVETAAFFLCLEPDLVTPDREVLARAVLQGDPANRWYDRTSQLILFGAPYIGVNGEHSAIDGHAVSSLIEAILGRARPARGVARRADSQACATLQWRLDAFKDTIAAARAASVAAAVPHLRVGAARSNGSTMRHDVRIQLAVQLAHLELTGRVAGVYQPTHMRRYVGGRTEVVRPATAAHDCLLPRRGRGP